METGILLGFAGIGCRGLSNSRLLEEASWVLRGLSPRCADAKTPDSGDAATPFSPVLCLRPNMCGMALRFRVICMSEPQEAHISGL